MLLHLEPSTPSPEPPQTSGPTPRTLKATGDDHPPWSKTWAVMSGPQPYIESAGEGPSRSTLAAFDFLDRAGLLNARLCS